MNTNIIAYRSSFAPVYFMLGSRPLIFDLEPEHCGRLDAILLNRDGDCAILPIQTQIASADKQRRREAPDSDAIPIALADLERDGWQNFGRITVTFMGVNNQE